MSSTFSIPADLAETDLTMRQITQIKEFRAIAQAAEGVLNPSDKRKRMAKARIEWATQAEDAVKDGKPVPPKPGRGEDDADPEDYGV